ncbi:cuticle protein 10.9-like [Oppia nitens]|uniref:cuticle protein 10.9-like n=1 Tax=Oppia nitens TaxID=1686743 RepID=UPI0023D9F66C|nr:cuticle protein 10.9-like [Oppia nitens]
MIKAGIMLSLLAIVGANMILNLRDNHNNNNNNNDDHWRSRDNDDYSHPIPYAFGYDVKDDKHGAQLSRKEESNGHGSVRGSYGYRDDKGIERRVEYVADKGGFRAVVKTNEPGTAKSNPADVEMLADPVIVDWGKWSSPQRSDNYKQMLCIH